MKTQEKNNEISVIVENYTKNEIINALMNYSESYYGERDILEYLPIEKLAEMLINLANNPDYTAMDLLSALSEGF